MFSRPVISPLKPVPTSSMLATRPLIFISPAEGAVMRLSSFKRVDLPAPLRPMMPRASPLYTVRSTPFSAMKVWPNRRVSVPMGRLGSSLPRTRAHQLCRSAVRVPPPIWPRRYCFFSPVISMTGSRAVCVCIVIFPSLPRHTVSIKVFSTRLNSTTPAARVTRATTALYKSQAGLTSPQPSRA